MMRIEYPSITVRFDSQISQQEGFTRLRALSAAIESEKLIAHGNVYAMFPEDPDPVFARLFGLQLCDERAEGFRAPIILRVQAIPDVTYAAMTPRGRLPVKAR